MKQSASFFTKTYLLFAAALICFFAFSKLWQSEKVIEWDITLYYSYLPATFIYQDLAFENKDSIWDEKLFFMNVDTEGHRYVKMTSGLAYMYAPFFFASHAYAIVNDNYKADGFSIPYQFGLMASSLFFALIGVWFLGKFLQNWFDQKIAILSVILLFLGSNLAYYTFVSPMSHAYSFSLISIIYFGITAYIKNQRAWLLILLGLASGLVVLIRPTNVILLLVPLFIIVSNYSQLNQKRLWIQLALAAIAGFLILIPQFLYWHYMTGSWIVYSYNKESFFFLDPKIWKGLFSYRKGWLLYSPIIVFALLGFIPLIKKHKQLGLVFLAILLIGVWVTFSWWCWWYGGSFGARPLIEFLPIVALGFAAFLKLISHQKKVFQILTFVIMGYLCYSSVFMSFQYTRGIIHYDAMSKELFWKQYMKPHYIKDYQEYLDPPDYKKAQTNEQR